MVEYFEIVVMSLPKRHIRKTLTVDGKQYTGPDAGGEQMHMKGMMMAISHEPLSFMPTP